MFKRADPAPRPPRRSRDAWPSPRGARRPIGPWWWLFVVAFALRALYTALALGPQAQPVSDSAEYDTVAWNLASGHGFSLDGANGPYPTAFVPPVVPWLTSLLYRGVGHSYFAALLLQCAIGALVPLLLGSLGGALFGGSVGLTAGWLAAFHPLLVFFSGYLLTETTFCVALLIALRASVAWLKTPRPGRAFGTGLAWGLATLTRPTAILLPAVVAAWAWAPLGLTVIPRERVRQLFLVALALMLVVGGWSLRNAAALGAFVPITTGGGRALLDANNPTGWADPATRGGADSRWFESRPELRGLGEVETDRRARAQAISFLGGHVREWPAMAAAKLGRFWRLRAERDGTGSWQRDGSPLSRLRRAIDPLLVWSVFLLPLALGGLVKTLRGPRRWFQLLPAFAILAFTLVAVVFWGSLRMRMPAEPLVTLFAAVGLEDLRRRMRTRARGFRVVEGRRSATSPSS